MFGKNQKQIVNVNELMEQMREGEAAKIQIGRIRRIIMERIYKAMDEFKDLDTDKTIYSWEYPFAFDDTTATLMDAVDFILPWSIRKLIDRDKELATMQNQAIEEKKCDQ